MGGQGVMTAKIDITAAAAQRYRTASTAALQPAPLSTYNPCHSPASKNILAPAGQLPTFGVWAGWGIVAHRQQEGMKRAAVLGGSAYGITRRSNRRDAYRAHVQLAAASEAPVHQDVCTAPLQQVVQDFSRMLTFAASRPLARAAACV